MRTKGLAAALCGFCLLAAGAQAASAAPESTAPATAGAAASARASKAASAEKMAAQAPLPARIASAAKRWKVNLKDVTISVVPLDGGARRLSHNASRSVSPASTAKLVTTLAALETLGAAYHWYTSFYVDERPGEDGVLRGNLYIRGGADPTLVVEDFAMELARLRQLGVKRIEGDVVVDRSLFDLPDANPGGFDGRASRPYNLPADAALLNYRNLSLELVPDAEAGFARVIAFPPMEGVAVPATVPLGKGGCGDWKSKLGFRLQKNADGTRSVKLDGVLPRACGAKNFNVIAFGRDEYFERVFRALWRREGGVWLGNVKSGAVPPEAERILVRMSPSLAEVVRMTNKWSNNVMARHLYLSLGAKRVRDAWEKEREAQAKVEKAQKVERIKSAKASQETGTSGAAVEAKSQAPRNAFPRGATLEDARAAINAWLVSRGLDPRRIWIENGSGLSREAHVTAADMTKLLAAGWNGPYMAEFVASLPITARDGTMLRRKIAPEEGRIKTGFLADVRSIGGYVRAEDGRRYAVFASVHGAKNMPGGTAFLDNVIEWVYKGR